jgi:hypothetical protein
MSHPLIALMSEVADEMSRQNQQWGEQRHPDGTGMCGDVISADSAKSLNDELVRMGQLTWRDILWEEVAEAFAEEEPGPLREELIQVAAVAIQWVAAIDRRQG